MAAMCIYNRKIVLYIGVKINTFREGKLADLLEYAAYVICFLVAYALQLGTCIENQRYRRRRFYKFNSYVKSIVVGVWCVALLFVGALFVRVGVYAWILVIIAVTTWKYYGDEGRWPGIALWYPREFDPYPNNPHYKVDKPKKK